MRFELWLTEGIRMRAICRDPAELVTALSRAEVRVDDLRELSPKEYSFTVPAASEAQVVRISGRCGAETAVLHRRGLFHFLRRFRKRSYLLLFPLPFLLGFILLSTFLWEIDVEGNRTLSKSEILSALESEGVYPGANGLRLDNARIRSRMQEALSKLSWCTVQVHGSRALVVVRERRLPPEIVDERLEREVAAARSGTIESLNVLEGKAVVRRGDTVLRGEMLISGELKDRQGEVRRVHAMGRVIARTWYEKSMVIPLTVQEKRPATVRKRGYGMKIGDLRLFFHRDSSNSRENYDKIYFEKRLVLFGLPLPVSVFWTEVRGYRLTEWELSEEEATALLKERLLEWLRAAAPEAELLEAEFSTEMTGEKLIVSMLAECREDIGTERAIVP